VQIIDGPWSAEIVRLGRWRYEITLITVTEPKMQEQQSWFVFGSRTHADNKARQLINRYNRREIAEANTWRVGPLGPGMQPTTHIEKPPEPPKGGSGVSSPRCEKCAAREEQDTTARPVVQVGAVQAARMDEAPPTFGFTPRRDLR
jgi:hypothetical protein